MTNIYHESHVLLLRRRRRRRRLRLRPGDRLLLRLPRRRPPGAGSVPGAGVRGVGVGPGVGPAGGGSVPGAVGGASKVATQCPEFKLWTHFAPVATPVKQSVGGVPLHLFQQHPLRQQQDFPYACVGAGHTELPFKTGRGSGAATRGALRRRVPGGNATDGANVAPQCRMLFLIVAHIATLLPELN